MTAYGATQTRCPTYLIILLLRYFCLKPPEECCHRNLRWAVLGISEWVEAPSPPATCVSHQLPGKWNQLRATGGPAVVCGSRLPQRGHVSKQLRSLEDWTGVRRPGPGVTSDYLLAMASRLPGAAAGAGAGSCGHRACPTQPRPGPHGANPVGVPQEPLQEPFLPFPVSPGGNSIWKVGFPVEQDGLSCFLG